MAANTNWYEQNGSATGSPAHGTEHAITSIEWKSVDDTTTSRTVAPVMAGSNSYEKYIYLKFTGSFNQISNVRFAHTAGTFGTGVALKGKVTSTYSTPSDASIPSASDMTPVSSASSGMTVGLSTTGPNGSASSSQTTTCYTQYLVTQLQTTGSASAGDTSSATLTVQYYEN